MDDEFRRIPKLAAIGMALAQFADSFTDGEFIRRKRKWVYQPNFVAFLIQYARAKNIGVTIYDNHSQFQEDVVLPVVSDRSPSWTTFTVSKPGQLAAAGYWIQRSFELWQEKQNKRKARRTTH